MIFKVYLCAFLHLELGYILLGALDFCFVKLYFSDSQNLSILVCGALQILGCLSKCATILHLRHGFVRIHQILFLNLSLQIFFVRPLVKKTMALLGMIVKLSFWFVVKELLL